jgi:hypothetical protein
VKRCAGRQCPNLGSAGFVALGATPALKGIAISCKHVSDAALAMLPRFPAFRALMPTDVPDEGFRHVGRCEQAVRLTRGVEELSALPPRVHVSYW